MFTNLILNYYNYSKCNCYVPYKNDIYHWLYMVFFKTNFKKFDITVSIVEKDTIKKLNNKFLKISKPTNVLCFSLEKNFLKKFFFGEIILCSKIIENESTLQKKNLKAHWAHIIIHSGLHLLNYNHKNAKEAYIMETKEIKILKLLGYSNPYL
ncbi:rRNA maturation RNase YbeY [Enterobacteriaceae endosymbiont of Donacia tomentosa]|uniref:rRNA maturation RNase YbeY n=1 Tax=Enterobacteriaceae endosymbiont of Donacia tomentosa TaxID=2675787 RepID=UPI00144920B8|nr:rRNA maturation RNase YbeY [Enterobacteriaceae endosymbiont of Donacia tomentosa]QJC31731.1 rRNA maturation RNase YbeY [Enterobacteriaceae endosymbiont of Donacia tomentosa]